MLILAEQENLIKLGPEVEADGEVLSRALHVHFLVFRLVSFGRRLWWRGVAGSTFSGTDEEVVVDEEHLADGGGFGGHLQEGGESLQRDLGVLIPPLDIFRSEDEYQHRVILDEDFVWRSHTTIFCA